MTSRIKNGIETAQKQDFSQIPTVGILHDLFRLAFYWDSYKRRVVTMVHPKRFLEQQEKVDTEDGLLTPGSVQHHDHHQHQTSAVTMIQSLWRRKTNTEDRRAWILLPVLIIPGIASSGLVIESSGVDNGRHAGQRVWMNAAFLAASRLASGIVNAAEILEEKLNNMTKGDDSFSSAEQAYQIRSAWLYHMSLAKNMVDERPGNRVRVYDGVCEFLFFHRENFVTWIVVFNFIGLIFFGLSCKMFFSSSHDGSYMG